MHFDAERAADIFCQNAHLIRRQIEMLGEQVLHHVRRLRALIDGEPLLAGIPVGDDGARLVGYASMSAGAEGGFDHLIRIGEGLIDRADVELALKAEIIAERRMDDRRLGVERCFRVGDGGQFFVRDVHQFTGVFGFGAAARDDGADGFALPARDIDGDRRLRRGFQALEMGQHADPGRHDLGEFSAGHDGDDSRRFSRGFGGNRLDAGMGVR